MADFAPASDPLAPPPSAPATATLPAGAADAQAKIDAIYADTRHPFHKGDPRWTEEVYKLHQTIHGTAAVPGAPPLPPPAASALTGPIESEILGEFSDALYAGGVPAEFGQGVVDVVTGFKADLPPVPAGYVPMTADAGWAALQGLEGAQASTTLAKAQRVVDVLKSLGPAEQARLDLALGGSGAGNVPGVIRAFARLHDLPPSEARRMVAQTFGGPAADRLFGPAPRR